MSVRLRHSLAASATLALALTLLGCTGGGAAPSPQAEPLTLDTIAERYVKLVLDVGQRDSGYVDAYYGPPEWRTAASQQTRSLEDLRTDAQTLLADLATVPPTPGGDELVGLRREFLEKQLRALEARVDILSERHLPFDEESRILYDAVAPKKQESDFQAILDQLDRLLPGPGPLVSRFERFKMRFAIPPEKVDAVFRRALDACRERTLAHIELPEDESFEIEYVRGAPWAAYNRYQGNYHSLIQVNTGTPIFIDRAIDLACHEGYPGHHVYNVLLERELVRGRTWIEFAVYPLYSPQSFISEGSANYGIEVAFPWPERVAFERETLFPLAGFDPDGAERYYQVHRLIDQLQHVSNEAARRFLDGDFDFMRAYNFLETYALMPRPTEAVKFIAQHRSYVINYSVGRDLVRAYIESRGGTDDDPATRWREFQQLLASPRLPSGLVATSPVLTTAVAAPAAPAAR